MLRKWTPTLITTPPALLLLYVANGRERGVVGITAFVCVALCLLALYSPRGRGLLAAVACIAMPVVLLVCVGYLMQINHLLGSGDGDGWLVPAFALLAPLLLLRLLAWSHGEPLVPAQIALWLAWRRGEATDDARAVDIPAFAQGGIEALREAARYEPKGKNFVTQSNAPLIDWGKYDEYYAR